MLSASEHLDFTSAVAEQRIADLRRQASEHAQAKAARASKKAARGGKAALRAPRVPTTKAPRQAVVFIRASAHN